MENVLKRMSLKARINLDNIFYLYNTEKFTYEDFEYKTVNVIISNSDRQEKLMIISLYDERSKTIVSIDISNLLENNINLDSMKIN